MRLVDTHVTWGLAVMVFLTVRLKKQGDEEFIADYCMHQYADLVVRAD